MFRTILRSAAIAALVAASLVALPARAADLAVDGNLRMLCGVATGTSNASTLANKCGVITTESATTAQLATFTETITNTTVAATDVCTASVTTAGTGIPVVTHVTPAAGSLVIIIQNNAATAVAFNAVLKIAFICFKAAA